MKLIMHTVLSPATCRGNIKNSATEYFFYREFTKFLELSPPMTYKFKKEKIKLKVLRNRRNGLEITFYGEINKGKKGTIISGDFRMHRFGIIFLIIWEIGVIAIALFILVALISTLFNLHLVPGKVNHDVGLPLIIPFIMPIAGVLMYIWGKKIAEKDEKEITAFLQKTCNAVKVKDLI